MSKPAKALNVPGATLKQERLAEALHDPSVKTKREALIKAGYSPTTASGAPGRQIALVGTQKALAARTARQRDKARELEELAGTRAVAAIETCDDPQTLVGTWSTARKARFDYPDEDAGADRALAEAKYKRAIHLAFLFGYIAAKRAFTYESAPPVATEEG